MNEISGVNAQAPRPVSSHRPHDIRIRTQKCSLIYQQFKGQRITKRQNRTTLWERVQASANMIGFLWGEENKHVQWYTAVCIMIDRLQKRVKCNFPSPLIGIHGQPHWRLGVSGFIWFESTGKVRLPKYGNCSVPLACIFTLLHYKMWYYSLKDNLQSVKNNSLWGTPQGLRVVHSVDTVKNLL